jgi:hypothetical protein
VELHLHLEGTLEPEAADVIRLLYAEEHGLTMVFSLDRDFHVHRALGRRPFVVVP